MYRHLINYIIRLRKEIRQMARTTAEITAELQASKAAFDNYKAAADAKFQADAQKISDLTAQIQDLTGVDAASADLSADIAGATVPTA